MEEASMADNKQNPPGEEAATVVHQQKKLDEAAAMTVVEDQKPAVEVALRYPVSEVAEAVAFVDELKARLDAAPDVRDGLLDLLVGFGSSSSSSGHGARAAASRAAGLLAAHPDALQTFTAYLSLNLP